MAVVTGAMSALLPKLEDMLERGHSLKGSVKGDIMVLKTELESLQDALIEGSKNPAEQLVLKAWAKDARDLSYDILDSMDLFMVPPDSSPPTKPRHILRGFIHRCLNSLTAKMKIVRSERGAGDMQDIENLTKEVSKLLVARHNIDDAVATPATTSTVDPRTSLYSKVVTELPGKRKKKVMPELIGTDEARVELIAKLMNGRGVPKRKQYLKIVSIFGIGGLGKTALADVVYLKLKAQFDCGAFISVSPNPDMARIFKEILYQFDRRKYASIVEEPTDESLLIGEIGEYLKDKRYIVVIDDIWDISAWEMIKSALVDNHHGNKVITTTRKMIVAKHIGGVYKLKPLSCDNSKRLFHERIFGVGEECPNPQLNELSDKIFKRCGGLPFATIAMASLLASEQENLSEWNKVYNSIGVGLESSLGVNRVRSILSLSYYDLPFHLRTCLLYVRLFPDNQKIRRDQLILMWIAEGLVEGDNLFDVGESYFEELISSSLLQPVVTDAHDRTEVCCVHDMVLDLITSLAIQENFITVWDNDHCTSIPNKVRRLFLQKSKAGHTTAQATLNLSQVRSLTVSPGAMNLLPPLSIFQVLRVLELEGCDLSETYNLRDVGNLFQLRYLGLRNTCISNLPDEIGRLRLLQTLDLRGYRTTCNGAKQLPTTIAQLGHLMCLYIDRDRRLPDGFGNTVSLQQLFVVNVAKSPNIVKELGHLTELRVLEVHWVETLDDISKKALLESLSNLHRIQSLCISTWSSSCLDFMDEGWAPPQHICRFRAAMASWFTSLPAWIDPSLLPNLSDLDMEVKRLRQGDIEILGRLPTLQCLRLTVSSEDEDEHRCEILVVAADSFQWLRECRIWNGMALTFETGAMPRVRGLEFNIRVCKTEDSIGGTDLGFQGLPSLERVTVELDCRSASYRQVKEVKSMLKAAANAHPNHPTIHIDKIGKVFEKDNQVQAQAENACSVM